MNLLLAIATAIACVASAGYVRKTHMESVNDAGRSDLRSLGEKAAEGGKEVFGACIHIGGLLVVPTKEELAVLDQVLPEAFNVAQETIGLEMYNANSKTTILRNSSEGDHHLMIMSEFGVQWNEGFCTLCTSTFLCTWRQF